MVYNQSSNEIWMVFMALLSADNSWFDLDHSRPFDVHTWSDYSEVNSFVGTIYDVYFSQDHALSNIGKHHLKKVLIDLYVTWLDDPDLCIGFDLMPSKYKGNLRYNNLKITRTTIDVVKALSNAGLIDYVRGFRDRREGGQSRKARMKATTTLIDQFNDAKINRFDIGFAIRIPKDRRLRPYEPVVMRIKKVDDLGRKINEDVEYEDTPKIQKMRKVLNNYNLLLVYHHIDLSNNDARCVESKGKRIWINQQDKYTRRIFNNNKWNNGGRFYGGFWQRVPSEYRPFIRIDGKRTIEVDYSAHHPVLLYARKGINYWKDIETDPYIIEQKAPYDHPVWQRDILKILLLTALNCSNDMEAIRAARAEIYEDHRDKLRGIRLEDNILIDALAALREKHRPIKDLIARGRGIELQYLDSQISEQIIKEFTKDNIPVLCVHDSYIVWEEYANDLHEVVNDAWRKLSRLSKKEITEDVFGTPMPTNVKSKQIGYFDEEIDHEEEGGGKRHQEILALKASEYVSQRHIDDLKAFEEWRDRPDNQETMRVMGLKQ